MTMAYLNGDKQAIFAGARLVSGAELHALLPGNQTSYDCALYMPQDGRAEPQHIVMPGIVELSRIRVHA